MTINFTVEERWNLLVGFDYLKKELEQLDCPDFDCNGWELLFEQSLIQTIVDAKED